MNNGIVKRFGLPASQRRAIFGDVPGHPGVKRFIGYEGDPGTRRTVPMQRRATGLSGLSGGVTGQDNNGFPTLLGAPGSAIPVYDEREMWGTDGPGGAQLTNPVDPNTPQAVDPGPQVFDPGISIPFGVSIIRWRNPTTMQSVPILSGTPSATPVLSLNLNRNSLLIQNNSTATSPDIAPTFYIGFNAAPSVGLSLAIPPLTGILFDIITPRDSIFVLFGGGSGASQVTQGVVIQGTYAPI